MLWMVVGGLIPTFVVSRLILWFLRTWEGGRKRIVFSHAIALLIAGFVGGMGMADGGAFAGATAIGIYALPQAVWLALDLFQYSRRARQTQSAPA